MLMYSSLTENYKKVTKETIKKCKERESEGFSIVRTHLKQQYVVKTLVAYINRHFQLSSVTANMIIQSEVF